MFSLIFSLVVALSEPSNYQTSRLICNGQVVAEYILDIRTTKWVYNNDMWLFLQYDKNILAEYKPKKSERCYAVNSL